MAQTGRRPEHEHERYEAFVRVTARVTHLEVEDGGETLASGVEITVLVQTPGFPPLRQELYLSDVHRCSLRAWEAALAGETGRDLPLEVRGDAVEFDGGLEGDRYCDGILQRLTVWVPREWLRRPLMAALLSAEAEGLPFAKDAPEPPKPKFRVSDTARAAPGPGAPDGAPPAEASSPAAAPPEGGKPSRAVRDGAAREAERPGDGESG